MGGAVLIYLAALQGIPGELYEAAELDGAGLSARIWHVTIPQTRLILSLMLLLQIVATMQVFIEPFILANGGGPEDSRPSRSLPDLPVRVHFNDFGGAAALGVMLMLVRAGRLLRRLRAAQPNQDEDGTPMARDSGDPDPHLAAQLGGGRGKAVYWTLLVAVVMGFTLAFLGPLYWMVTGALKSPAGDRPDPADAVPASMPLRQYYNDAWDRLEPRQAAVQHVYYAAGALAVPARRWTSPRRTRCQAAARVRQRGPRRDAGHPDDPGDGPAVVPQYLTVDRPADLRTSTCSTRPWAIWLPAVANAFNIFLLKRFFDSIPQELLEAAAIDGAAPLRILWSIVLPMSRPILGRGLDLRGVAVWKDFLWPLLVLPDTDKQTDQRRHLRAVRRACRRTC